MIDKRAKIAILATLLLLGIVLFYTDDTLSQPWRTLLPFAYVALGVFLSRKLAASPNDQSGAPVPANDQSATTVPSRRVNLRQIAKAACCIVALFLWLVIAMPWINTPIGAIVVLVPCFLLLAAALFFFSRSY
jgi:hypothetical protein